MSEFKIHHLTGELLEVLGCVDSAEKFVELLQTSNTENDDGQSHCVLKSRIYTLAKNSHVPKQFIEKYEELKLKNVDHLQEFMQILCKISEDNNVKAFIAESDKEFKSDWETKSEIESKIAIDMTPDDLPLVKTRLKNAIKKDAEIYFSLADEINKSENIIQVPSIFSWFRTRASMSWDFPPTDLQPHNICTEIPICSQESFLIEDLLNLFVGVEGNLIEAKPLMHPLAKREFIIDRGVDETLAQLVSQILPLASHYSMIRRFMEEKIEFEYGQVNNALCSALHHHLIEYGIFVCQLETSLISGALNLHKLWFYVQNSLHVMGLIADICVTISKSKAKGGKVLSLLHEQTLCTIGDAKGHEVCYSLSECASVPYFKILQTWIYKGIINDPQKEFLVEEVEIINRDNSLIEDYSTEYWIKRYAIRRERIPKFLEKVADIVLRTGKYLNVILQCKTIKSKEEDINYKIEEREYVEVIEKAYSFASKTLLDLLLIEHNLMGRLCSIKHYFLLDQGDFVLQFLHFCERELNRNVDNVVLIKLQSFFEISTRLSSACNDPFKEDVRTILLNDDLQTQMSKILSIQTNDEHECRSQKRNMLTLTGFESFTFGYKVHWPISIILNYRAIACYQMIFRHLFYCKYVERMLCQVWRSGKIVKKYSTNSSSQYISAFALRQRMLHCVQNLEYHMMVEVIEPNWIIFQDRIAKAQNVDDVLIYHLDFQDKCLEDCMLTSPLFLKIITQLLEICREYCSFIQSHNPENKELMTSDEAVIYENFIQQLDTQFTVILMELLDEINGIGRDSNKDRLYNLLYRMDYEFYTAKLDNIVSQRTRYEAESTTSS